MATYAYKAMDGTGRITRGRLAAATVIDLESRLKRQSLDLILARPIKSLARSRAIPRRDLIEFCFHLEQLMRSGVPIVDSLRDLRDSVENPRFRDTMAELANDIESGAGLSEAMARQPHVFDSVFIGVIAAGEHAGKLPDALQQLSEAIKWQDEIAAQSKQLTLYPAFLCILVTGIFVFLLLHLVPQMAGFLAQLGQNLPLSTRVLLALSYFLVHHGAMLVVAVPIGLLSILLAAKAKPLQRDRLALSVPLIGPILRKLVLARISSLLALMYGAGIPILDALRRVAGAAGNRVLEQGLQQAEQRVGNGESLAIALQKTQLFPPLVIRMLHIGEATGALDSALRNIAYFYSRDAKESVARIQVLVEPVLTVIIGLLLGWIMLAVLGPIYDTVARVRL